ncbi:response regulator transcription factor [Dyadobacter crusticola]|uniref:response regulator transcription factor n=1 Tax=Dyadobacter crusticola TaxID=292407 RepID=UPI0012F860B9|nr:response regulator transcription factor [Dyadobacter crusticola]
MRALIVDDHFMIRNSIKFILEDLCNNIEFLEADNYYNAVRYFSDPDISLIILDIDIPGGTGIDMVKQIRAERRDVRILICSAADERQIAMDYIIAGADGYLEKSVDPVEATRAVEMVLNGKRYVSADVQRQLMVVFSGGHETGKGSANVHLSAREKQVMHLLLEGKWIKEIALALNLRANTISTFKSRIFSKLGATSLFDLEKKAKEKGQYY